MANIFKPILAGVIGLLAWTLSIHVVPVTLDAQPSSLTPCEAHQTTKQIFESMIHGIVTHIHNDGSLLSIEISPGWDLLSHESRQRLYHALGCLAQQEHVVFQVLPTQISGQ